MGIEAGTYWLISFMLISVTLSGQNLVPKPPLQVQEAVEKWRNPPRSTCCDQWITPLHVSTNYCLGLSTDSKNEQCQLQFTSEQQPSQHDCAFIVFGKLLLVLNHELYGASAGSSAPAPPPQLRHKCWDDILRKNKHRVKNRTILVKKKEKRKMPIPSFYRPRVCAMWTLHASI